MPRDELWSLTRRAIEDRVVAMRPTPARHPSTRSNSRFTIGRDANGHWIVADVKGLCGGIFADRSAAVHYALAECNYNPGDVCAAPEGQVLSLDVIFDAALPAARRA